MVTTNSGILYLIGGVTDGGNGLIKNGQDMLILGPSNGTFTGQLSINGGYVQVADPAALTTGTTVIGSNAIGATQSGTVATTTTLTVASTANLFVGEGVSGTGTGVIPAGDYIVSITDATHVVLNTAGTTAGATTLTFYSGAVLDLNGIAGITDGNIILNGAGTQVADVLQPAALYNSSSSAASVLGKVQIGAVVNSLKPSIGGYGNITLAGIVSDNVTGQAWNKVGPDSLILTGANTFTGAVGLNAGNLSSAVPRRWVPHSR